MTIFGLSLTEIILVGTTFLGLAGAYYRLVGKTETSEKEIRTSNASIIEKLESMEKHIDKSFDDIEKNAKAQQERDKEWRAEQEKRISVLEAESRGHMATNASVVSSLADLKAQTTYLTTRVDSYLFKKD